ncbi:MAG: tyrosine-type recombinase/integrase [Candidatus Bathyarchaeota archaeon]|nr:tyrosine-type recombinase/integrase [Candidatus Bathyarchaeota archaeon]
MKGIYTMQTFLGSQVSGQTKRSYAIGLKKFIAWYGKPIDNLLKEKDPSKIVEQFFVDIKKKLCHNTARTYTISVIQFCRYNNIDIKLRKGLGAGGTKQSTRDHILLIDQAREMYKIGSLEDKVMVKIWLLGLRISDAVKLEWKDFQVSDSDPIEILVKTGKEEVVAHVFIDSELQELMAKYIRIIDQENKYLFQGITTKQLLRRLQSLAKKAGIETNGKVFGWHLGRKLFMRTGTQFGINIWSLKMMVGKAIDPSIATYIRGVSLVEDAKKISNTLRMEEPKSNGRVGNLEETVQIMTKAFGKFLRQILKEQGYGTGIGFTMDYDAMDDEEVIRWYLGER